MHCAFCGSGQSNVFPTNALAVTGLLNLPACPVDREFAKETFARPLTITQLKAVTR